MAHVAAVLARDPRLLVARHGAEHARSERLRPRAQEQSHAARRRVHEHGVARAHAMRAMQQVLGRHALQHARGRRVVVDVVGQRDDLVRGHRAHVDVGARRRARVRDTIARQQVVHTLADVEHDTRRLHARHRGRLQQRIESGAHVDVDVVDADRAVPQAHLARSRRRGLERGRLQDFGSAVPRDDDAARGHGCGGGARRAAPRRRAAGTRAIPRSRLRRPRRPRGRRTPARVPAARRTSTPSARTCGRRRSRASASRSPRSGASAASRRGCSTSTRDRDRTA